MAWSDFFKGPQGATNESTGWMYAKGAGIVAGTVLLGKAWCRLWKVHENSGFFKKWILRPLGYAGAFIASTLTLGYLPQWLGVDQKNVSEGKSRRVTVPEVVQAGREKGAAGLRELANKLDSEQKEQNPAIARESENAG